MMNLANIKIYSKFMVNINIENLNCTFSNYLYIIYNNFQKIII